VKRLPGTRPPERWRENKPFIHGLKDIIPFAFAIQGIDFIRAAGVEHSAGKKHLASAPEDDGTVSGIAPADDAIFLMALLAKYTLLIG
jgi:hypothetical protein